MRRCAFLTLEDSTGYVIDDELAYAPLAALGWQVDTISWRCTNIEWQAYGAVVIRSTWDYVNDPDAFLDVLGEIERSGTPLFNGLDLVRWNIRKTYLRDLAERGVAVVPTIWRDRLQPNQLPDLIEEVGTAEVVIKPVVGLNAHGAFRFDALNCASPVSMSYALTTPTVRYWRNRFFPPSQPRASSRCSTSTARSATPS